MNFDLTEEQKLVRENIAAFAKSKIAPLAAGFDRNHEFPTQIIRELGSMGYLGMFVPEAYGGSDMDAISYAIVMEEVSKACAGTGVVVSVQNSLVNDGIVKFGSEEIKRKYLPDLASGRKVGCFMLSEPSTGSDAAAQKTVAVRKGDKYILNGTKNWITNGREGETAIVIAMTAPEKGNKGITAFVVERSFPGYSVGKVEEKLGINASSTTQINFDDCEVPVANRLGEEGEGFKVAMTILDGGRIGIAGQALGIAQAALEEASRYIQERKAFGQALANFQGLQWTIADMAMAVEASRLLTYRAAYLKQEHRKFSKEAAMAKLMASETAMMVAHKALQLHGGYGYVKDYPAERHFRDAKITEIYEGTSEIQRIVIASHVLKEYAA